MIRTMSYTVDFNDPSTTGLESSPFAAALAGLRANEARYFKNKYGHTFTVEPASNAKGIVDRVHRILKEEREGMEIPEELSAFKFARQKSKLAGTIRGSYFTFKNEY
jgi:hypothetical protein